MIQRKKSQPTFMRDYASFLSKKIEKGLVINNKSFRPIEVLPNNTMKKDLNKTENNMRDPPNNDYSSSTLMNRGNQSSKRSNSLK